MAYVRRRGNQLAIVAGDRNPETKNVEQRVLFALYSKPEALEVLGRTGDKQSAARFEMLMERAHPEVTFSWTVIRKSIAANLNHLPESYEYKQSRLTGRFREDLVGFARTLMLADPQHLLPAATLIRENRAALEYLSELIAWRLETCGEREPNEWNTDNRFLWRFTLQGKDVPCDAEEHAIGLWERRDLVHAQAAFEILLEAFPTYADGWNHLGLIALEREDLALAEGHFRKTIEVGRKSLPKRVSKSSWWSDMKTRPYMRGLRNLTSTLLRDGRYDEASEVTDGLARECGDDHTAASYRAAIALNVGDWETAATSAARIRRLWPEEGLLEALARVELGRHDDALEPLLHAALNRPRAARILLGLPFRPPTNSTEATDHDAGVELSRLLPGYLRERNRPGRSFCARVVEDRRVARLMARVEELASEWSGKRDADRAIFDELTRTRSPEFAALQAHALRDLVPAGRRSPSRARMGPGARTAQRRRLH